MVEIDASKATFQKLNEAIRQSVEDVKIIECLGQRFIAAGLSKRTITIHGTPGNALGAYLNGAKVEVFGNTQDAVGDTMNEGEIIVHGNIGDAAGYAMRGGRIFVQGNAGYRAGIHMKAYKDKAPALVIGGSAGSFLGEYQAGGVIIVLGLNGKTPIVGNFPCTGMHGGTMILRSDGDGIHFPHNVKQRRASKEDILSFKGYLEEFCYLFHVDLEEILSSPFTIISPDDKNPYKQMYVIN